MIHRALSRALLLLMAAMLPWGVVAADKKSSREKEILRRVQQQLQQVQGQVSTLEQEKARLAQDLGVADKAAKQAMSKAARVERDLRAERQKGEAQAKELELSRKDLAEERQRLAETRNALEESRKQLAEAQRTLQATRADKERLEAIKTRNEREFALCEDKNGKLYRYSRELMVRYDQKGFEEVMQQREPFTGLKQVEIENLLQEYRDKLDEQKIIKPPGGG